MYLPQCMYEQTRTHIKYIEIYIQNISTIQYMHNYMMNMSIKL